MLWAHVLIKALEHWFLLSCNTLSPFCFHKDRNRQLHISLVVQLALPTDQDLGWVHVGQGDYFKLMGSAWQNTVTCCMFMKKHVRSGVRS